MRYTLVLGICLIVVFLDQLTKWITIKTLPMHSIVPIIDGFFNLVHIQNRGAAFGILNRSDIAWQFWLFLVATLVAMGVIFYLVRTSKHDTMLFCSLGLILGGAVGNLIDRIRFRAVVDFLDFYVGNWHWPAFNVADIAICIGAGLTCIAMYRAEKALYEQKKHGSPKKKKNTNSRETA